MCVSPVKLNDDGTKLILKKLNMMDEKMEMVLRKLHRMSKNTSSDAVDEAAGCLPDGVVLPLDSIRRVAELDHKVRDPETKRKLVGTLLCIL